MGDKIFLMHDMSGFTTIYTECLLKTQIKPTFHISSYFHTSFEPLRPVLTLKLNMCVCLYVITLKFIHDVDLCISYNSENKPRLFP
jgi:hypothetical protein